MAEKEKKEKTPKEKKDKNSGANKSTGRGTEPATPNIVEEYEISRAAIYGRSIYGTTDVTEITPDKLTGKGKKKYNALVEEGKIEPGGTFSLVEARELGLLPKDFQASVQKTLRQAGLSDKKNVWASQSIIEQSIFGVGDEEKRKTTQDALTKAEASALEALTKGHDIFAAGQDLISGIDTGNEVANAFKEAAQRELASQLQASGISPTSGGSALSRTLAGIEAMQAFGTNIMNAGQAGIAVGRGETFASNPFSSPEFGIHRGDQAYLRNLALASIRRSESAAHRSREIFSNSNQFTSSYLSGLGAYLSGGQSGGPVSDSLGIYNATQSSGDSGNRTGGNGPISNAIG